MKVYPLMGLPFVDGCVVNTIVIRFGKPALFNHPQVEGQGV